MQDKIERLPIERETRLSKSTSIESIGRKLQFFISKILRLVRELENASTSYVENIRRNLMSLYDMLVNNLT